LILKLERQPENTGSMLSETVIVDEHVDVHPIASVTVYVYVPFVKPDCNPVPVSGAVPPTAVTSISPSVDPKQLAFVTTEQDAVKAGPTSTDVVDVAVQPVTAFV